MTCPAFGHKLVPWSVLLHGVRVASRRDVPKAFADIAVISVQLEVFRGLL